MQTRRQLRWEDLPENPTQNQVWQTAASVLIWAARNYRISRSVRQQEEILRYARETFAEKRGWLTRNQPGKAESFYTNSRKTPTAGDNWIGQLVKLANEYAYLDFTQPMQSNTDAQRELAEAEADLLYHATTRPTKSGHTHRPEDPSDEGRVLEDGKLHVISRCGQFIAKTNLSRMPTCKGCLTGVGAGLGTKPPKRTGRSYISVICPTCLAVAGEDCTGSEAHPIPTRRQVHAARAYLTELPSCRECGAVPGDPCVDPAGENLKAPHGVRTSDLLEETEASTKEKQG